MRLMIVHEEDLHRIAPFAWNNTIQFMSIVAVKLGSGEYDIIKNRYTPLKGKVDPLTFKRLLQISEEIEDPRIFS